MYNHIIQTGLSPYFHLSIIIYRNTVNYVFLNCIMVPFQNIFILNNNNIYKFITDDTEGTGFPLFPHPFSLLFICL